MGTYTKNYNFYIPDGSEFGEIIKLVLQPNFTIADQQLANLKDKFESYYTVTEIDEKFKNLCPYAIGEILLTTNSENPATKYLGTTWQKIEGRMLLGTSGSGASKQTGGSMTKTIAQANLPNVKLSVDAHTHTQPKHYHGTWGENTNGGTPPFGYYDDTTNRAGTNGGLDYDNRIFKTTSDGGDITGSSSPKTSALGSGQALDITPSYYTVHMWLRTS